MLTYLKIVNYALIENSEVEFTGGFTVVTGESGAGKSIMMSALELLCGGRTDRGVIRTGCDRCAVSGIFTVPPEVAKTLAEVMNAGGLELPDPFDTLTLRRVVTPTTTRNFVDDTPVSARVLAEIGVRLVDLHGANEQISLTVPAHQLSLLDNYADLSEMRAACANLYAELNALKTEREEFDRLLPNADEADHLQLMIEEIDAVSPLPGEDSDLASRQRRGANARQIIESCNMIVNALTESEDCVADKLGALYHTLSELERIDSTLTGNLPGQLAELQNGISELSAAISAIAERVDLDPEALAAIESRLSDIYTLKRRYGPTMEQLLSARDAAEKRIAEFQAAKERRAGFDKKETELTAALRSAAEKLSAARKQHAGKFLEKTGKKLAAIGFSNAVLKAEFTEIEPGASGMDKLELLFSANRGEDARPLRKIASSGELSRLMLALKTVLADADAIPTVVFDEIDMNIGGETANRVGDELYALGRKRQILCISHLAQVAARADEHFKVEKNTAEGRTVSSVAKLSDPAAELARMLGGGESALRHAQELIKSVKK